MSWTTISELRAARAISLCRRLWWPPAGGIGDPTIDIGFMPTGAVHADFQLGWERALGDFAVDSGTAEASAGENGLQADDTVCYEHSCAASCRMRLTLQRQDRAMICLCATAI